MSNSPAAEVSLPALRGLMGDWIYYATLMTFKQVSSRVSYATDLHTSEGLSQLIQRRLDEERGPEIAEYLRNQPERFFNSLVLATYDGQPDWYPLSDVHPDPTLSQFPELSPSTISSVGFLTLRGDERLFALDGQHRLAGIKKAVAEAPSTVGNEELSVILVAHQKTGAGLQRSRRLFTTLNKTARHVSKGDIIALDEDDVMAICVRRLIEDTDLFRGERVAFVATNNMPTANRMSLTTIGNLYDILKILFQNRSFDLKPRRLKDLQIQRPPEAQLQRYFEYSQRFFRLLQANFSELAEFFEADETESVVSRHRNGRGGSVLFRPIGLELFTRLISVLSGEKGLTRAVETVAKLPRQLAEEPYRLLLWEPSTRTMRGRKHIVTLREVLLRMVRAKGAKFSASELTERYRRDTAQPNADLPPFVV